MVGLVAVLKIKPGMEEKVNNAMLKMTEAVLEHEKDCLLYEPYVPADGTPEIYVIEKYASLEALEEHRKTAHFLEFRETIWDFLADPPQSTLLKPIS